MKILKWLKMDDAVKEWDVGYQSFETRYGTIFLFESKFLSPSYDQCFRYLSH